MKKVIICGLGAVGMTYAVKLRGKCELKILVDAKRLERYTNNKPLFNGEEQTFDYILPSDSSFVADLIIIATKSYGLIQAIGNIKNFTTSDTTIISLLNGISSEELIQKTYPQAKVLKSYFIGHSAVRDGDSVIQDGVGTIVVENNPEIEEFFEECGIDYSVPDDIDYSMWLKFTMNIFSNQVSAILNMTFGDLKKNKTFIEFAKKIIAEVRQIAEKKGVNNTENLEKDALYMYDGSDWVFLYYVSTGINRANGTTAGIVENSDDITFIDGQGTVVQAGKVKNALTVGSKSFDGSSAVSIEAADLGALTAIPDTYVENTDFFISPE